VIFTPLVFLATQTRDLKPNEMNGIRVWDQGRTNVQRSPVPGMMRFTYHAQFKNETPRELASLKVKLLVDLGSRRVYVSPVRSLTKFANLNVPVVGALAPMSKTEYVENIAFDLPASYWRTDLYDRLTVVGATTFVNPDLHDAGHLFARLMNGKDEEEIEMLKRDPSLLKVMNPQKFTPLLMAFGTCGPKMIQYLISKGANPKATTTQGAGIMHLASINPYPGVQDLALKLGGDVNGKTKHGRTPLLRAIVAGAYPCWRWLLAHRANPRYEQSPGHPVAQFAVREGQEMALQDLVKAGVSPRTKDSTGQGWMHYAVFNYMMMEPLRRMGVPVDDANSKNGETPLMLAAWSGWEEPQVWLLQHGASPTRKDKFGRTAEDYALSRVRKGDAYAIELQRRLFRERVRRYATGS
jgi:ankyrin repeat protein